MVTTDKSFSNNEITLLKSLIGKELFTLDAYIVARGDIAWNTVRLHCSDLCIDVNNGLEEITVDEFGNADEFGIVRISKTDDETLIIPGVGCEATIIPINKTIHSISVVDELIEIGNNNETVSKLKYAQAIIFNFEDESLILDKEVWFDETLAIKAGPDPNTLIYDDSVNWEDDPLEDPTTHYHVKTEGYSI